MSTIVNDEGKFIPVTALSFAKDNIVTQVKTDEKDGYIAVQVACFDKKRKSAQPYKVYKEFRGVIEGKDKGATITITDFAEGDKLKLTALSKGKGFAGGMKRHNFHGLRATHGVSLSHRALGSTGMHTEPARTFKKTKMAGHMGVDTITLRGIEIVKIDMDKKLLYVKGPVPGGRNTTVYITK